jgi:hypothetical protein
LANFETAPQKDSWSGLLRGVHVIFEEDVVKVRPLESWPALLVEESKEL